MHNQPCRIEFFLQARHQIAIELDYVQLLQRFQQ
jgi:hypothetical protein